MKPALSRPHRRPIFPIISVCLKMTLDCPIFQRFVLCILYYLKYERL